MTIDKIDGVWAETGDKEADITAQKKAAGWVGDDQPGIERFNYLENRQDVAINAIIEERVNTYYDGASDPKKMISTGLWDESWGVMNDPANVITGGSTKEYRDMATVFNSAGEPRLLVLDAANTAIEMWDPRSKTLLVTTDDLSLDLLVPANIWVPLSMCSDGVNVYVVFANHTPVNEVYRVQSWVIDDDDSDWSVKSGWAATGTALIGSGPGTSAVFRVSKIIVASATKLAVGCGWNTVTAASTAAVSIMAISNGTISVSGAGDCPTSTSQRWEGGLCSDGTNVFFSTTSNLCSLQIASPTTGCGGASYPALFSRSVMASAGNGGTFVSARYTETASSTDTVVMSSDSSDATLEELIRGVDTFGVVGDHYIFKDARDIIFDGVNMWIMASVERIPGVITDALIKIDASKFAQGSVTEFLQIGNVANAVYHISSDVEPSTEYVNNRYRRLAFDGRDIWAIIESDSGQTASGKIFRLPLATLRS